MVAIVGGNALGLGLGSMATLGAGGVWGHAPHGRSGEGAFVNAATGNLVLQGRDDLLASRGLDLASIRTYNSLGLLNDDNGDNWSLGFYTRALRLTGTRNTAGSTLTKIDSDGGESTYTWDAGRSLYLTAAGAGAHDTIVYETATSQWLWQDGDTALQERYDSAATSRLLSSKDADGLAVSYTYNGAGLLTSASSASGETVHYDYTGTLLTQVRTVHLVGSTPTTLTRVRYAYDASNRLSSVTVDLSPTDNSVADGKTYVTTYTYDGTSRRVASALQSDGSGLRFTYVQVGSEWRVATIRDALDQTTAFAYDTANRKTTVTSPLGFATTYEYDAAGQLLKVSAPPGQATSFSWDASGNLTRTTDAEGRTVDMAYDANGNQTLVRDGAGNTVTRTFSTTNLLLTETTYAVADPDGAGSGQPTQPMTTRHVWDAAGKRQLRFVVSAEGRILEHRYNGYGERATTIAYAGGAFAVGSLGATQVPTEAEMASWIAGQDKARTQRTDFAYDTRSLLKTATAFATVDASGNGVADTGRSVSQFVYDQAGLLLKTIAPGSGVTETTYDGIGRVLAVKDALGRITTTQYQDSTAKTAVTLASGLVTTSAWDKAGRLVSVIEGTASVASLGETKWFHDANGRLRMTQDPTGVRTWMLYDDAGRQVAGIDADGTCTEYTYDKSDRLTRTVVFGTRVATAALVDGAGKPADVALATIRPATTAADRTSWRSYDAAGRLVKTVNESGAVVESFFDGASRVVRQVAYANAIDTAALGANPTPSAITPTTNAAADRTTRLFHDTEGRLVATLDAEGFLVESHFDAAGRLSSTTRYSTATAAAQRPSGTLAALRPSAAAADQTDTLLYNAKGQVAGLVDAELRLTEKVYDANGNLARVVRYANRLASAPAATATVASVRPAAHAEDQVTAWTYDLLNRPSQETNAEGTVNRFAYDTVGNLVSTTRAFGTTEVRTVNARFDVQGRLTGELTAEGGALLTGSQTQAQIDAIWAQHGIAHAYDAAGRRTASTDANGNRTLFFFDSDGRISHTVNALGEVEERSYDAFGQLATSTRLGTRIALAGHSGGLVTTAVTNAVAAARNAALDSRQSFSYTATGAFATSTDALGHVTTRTVNAFGEVVSTVVPLGAGTTRLDARTLDRRGLELTSTRDSGGIGAVTQSQYDAFGRLVRRVDANGNVRLQSFDRAGRVVQTTDPLNATRSTTYDAFDRVVAQTDALGHTTTTSWSTSGRTMTVTTPEGVAVTTTRTRHGEVASVRDGRGNTTTYTYDRNGNVTKIAEPLARTTLQGFDKANRLIEITDARGTKSALAYDAAGRVLTRKVDPSGLALTTTYAFDAKGQTVSVTDPGGTVTTTSYDLAGRTVRQVVDPAALALATGWTWDAEGQALTVVDPTGLTTKLTYDKLGRRTAEQVDPSGLNLTRRWTYDKSGNAVTATDAVGKVSRFVYDKLDRLIWQVDPTGAVVKTTYDAQGRVAQTLRYAAFVNVASLSTPTSATQLQALVVPTAGKDETQWHRYDRDGRLRFTVDGGGAVAERRYDGNGNVVESIAYAKTIDVATWKPGSDPAVAGDAKDRRTRTVYDALDRATHVADAMGGVVRNQHDAGGNVVVKIAYATAIADGTAPDAAVASAADRVTRHAYDAAGRTVFEVDALGGVVRSMLDGAGRVTSRTEYARAAALAGDGAYSAAQIASAIGAGDAANDRTTHFGYDAAGRLQFSADAMGSVTSRVLDAAGRTLVRVDHATALADGAAWSTLARLPSDRISRATFDPAGRQVFAVDALGAVVETAYNGAGRVTATRAYAGMTALPADARVLDSAQVRSTLTANNTHDRRTAIEYDAAGRIVTRTTALGTEAEAIIQSRYDGVGRLVAEIDARGVALATSNRPWAQGERQRLGLPADAATLNAGQKQSLLDRSTTTFIYDAAGRRTSVVAPTSTTSSSYDAFGGAVRVVDPRGNAGFFYFDKLGRVTLHVDPEGYATQTTYAGTMSDKVQTVRRYATRIANASQDTLPTVVATASDAVTEYTHDKLGRILSTRDAANASESIEFGVGTNRFAKRVTNKLGGTAVYSFDKAGRQVSETLPVSAKNAVGVMVAVANQYVYDAFGDRIRTVEAVGLPEQRTTTFRYDASRRVTHRIGAAANALDPASMVTSSVTPAEVTRYNAFGDVVESIDRASWNGTAAVGGSRTLHWLDAAGNNIASVAGDGAVTTRSRDPAGLVAREVAYASRVTLPASPGLAPPTVAADGVNDRVTLFVHDASSRQTLARREKVVHWEQTSPSGPITLNLPGSQPETVTLKQSAWDAAGNLVQETDGRGNSTFHYYDRIGRRILTIDAEGYATAWEYNDLFDVATRETRFATRVGAYARQDDSSAAAATRDPAAIVASMLSGAGRAVDGTSAMRLVYAEGTNSSMQRYVGQFAAGDTLTATVWFKTNPTTSAGLFLGDAGGDGPYDNAAHTTLYGDDGWRVMTTTVTLSHADHQWIYLYADRDGVYRKAGNFVLYDRLELRSAQRGLVLAEGFEGDISAWGDGGASPLKVSLQSEPDRVSTSLLDRAGRITERSVLDVAFEHVDPTSGVSTKRMANAITQYAYDGLGNLTQQRERVAELADNVTNVWNVTDIAYDKLGRATERKDPVFTDHVGVAVRPTTSTEYDGLGNTSRILARGTDAASEADDRVTRFIYNVNGDRTQTIDAAGNVTQLDLDAHGGVARSTVKGVLNADGVGTDLSTVYRYDSLGRVVQQTDIGTGEVRKTAYNAFGEISGTSLGDGWQEFVQYNTLGKIQKSNTGDGVVKIYLYDRNGNATRQITSAASDLTGVSVLAAAQDGSLLHTFSSYDKRNGLVRTVEPDISYLRDKATIQGAFTQQLADLYGAISVSNSSGGGYGQGSVDLNTYHLTQVSGTGSDVMPGAATMGMGQTVHLGGVGHLGEVTSTAAFGVSMAWGGWAGGLYFNNNKPPAAYGFKVPDDLPANLRYRIVKSTGQVHWEGTTRPYLQIPAGTYFLQVQASNYGWVELSRLDHQYMAFGGEWDRTWSSTETRRFFLPDMPSGYVHAIVDDGTPSARLIGVGQVVDSTGAAVPGWYFVDTAALPTGSHRVTVRCHDAAYRVLRADEYTISVGDGSKAVARSPVLDREIWALSYGPERYIALNPAVTGPAGTFYIRPKGSTANFTAVGFGGSIVPVASFGGTAGTTYEFIVQSNGGERRGELTLDANLIATFSHDGRLQQVTRSPRQVAFDLSGTLSDASAGQFRMDLTIGGLTVSKWFTGTTVGFDIAADFPQLGVTDYANVGHGYSYRVYGERGGISQFVGQGSGSVWLGADFITGNGGTQSYRPVGKLAGAAFAGSLTVTPRDAPHLGATLAEGDWRRARPNASTLEVDLSQWLIGGPRAIDFSYASGDAQFWGTFLLHPSGQVELAALQSKVREPKIPLTIAGASHLTALRVGDSDSSLQDVAAGRIGTASNTFVWNVDDQPIGQTRRFYYEAANGSGGIIGRGYGTLSVASDGTVTFTQDPPLLLPSHVRFSPPAGTATFELMARQSGGAFTAQGTSVDGTQRLFDATHLRPGTGTNTWEVRYVARDGAGAILSSGTGTLVVHADGSTASSLAEDRRPTIVTLQGPPGLSVPRLHFEHRPLGGAGGYTSVIVSGTWDPAKNCTVFSWDASALLPPTGLFQSEYVMRLQQGDGTAYRNEVGDAIEISGVMTLGGGASSPVRFQQYVTQMAQQAQVTRTQSFNAFGEIAEERDDRVFQRMQAMVAEDGGVLDPSKARTTFTYNALGKLVSKTDAETSVVLANGYRYRDRPVTRYAYDLTGRIATSTDANGNSQRMGYAGAGERVAAQWAADGGRQATAYDVHGDARKLTDELDNVVFQDMNALGHLTQSRRTGISRVQNATDGNSVGATLVDTYQVDALGRRVKHTNAAGYIAKTFYDSLNRVVSTVSAEGRATAYGYTFVAAGTVGGILGAGGRNNGGYQVTTTGPDGRTLVDRIDSFGRTTWHKDLGNRTYVYGYDLGGRLTSQTSSEGQNIQYAYFANGFVREARDLAERTMSRYGYDNAGNRVWEAYGGLDAAGTGPAGILQDSDIQYDELNRISRVKDNSFDVQYDYDAVGNRRAIHATYWDPLSRGTRQRDDFWYTYDAANRFTTTKGSFAGSFGTSSSDTRGSVVLGTQGVQLTYDKAGQRTSARNADNSQETYSYSQDGFLEDMRLDGILRARRRVDSLGRTFEYKEWEANGAVRQTKATLYDRDSRVLRETTAEGVTNYFYFNDAADTQAAARQNGSGMLARAEYDANASSAADYKTTYGYAYWDSAKQATIHKQGSADSVPKWAPGMSSLGYDKNGYLKGAYDHVGGRSLTYVNNATGLALSRSETVGANTYSHFWYYAAGQRIGDVTTDPNDNARMSYAESLAINLKSLPTDKERFRNFKPATSADFDQNYEPINASYPSAAGASYTVRTGDTLRSIARALWGDAAMWYLIAEANDLASNSQLTAGQTLVIPNKVTNIHNNSETFRPYNPGEVIGSVDPTLPVPASQGKSCGGLAMVIMIVVAVVVTVYTAGAAAGYFASGATVTGAGGAAVGTVGGATGVSTWTAGVAALTGGITGSAGAVAGGMAAAAVGAAAGSAASQLVGMRLGAVDDFSWKAVAVAALGAGIGSGVGAAASSLSAAQPATAGLLQQGTWTRAAITAGATSAVTQVMTGRWSWREIAASAVGSAVGSTTSGLMGEALGSALPKEVTSFASRVAGGVAASWSNSAVMRGHDGQPAVRLGTMFVGALGNTLGDSLVASLNATSSAADGSAAETERLARQNGVLRDAEYMQQSDAILSRRAAMYGSGSTAEQPLPVASIDDVQASHAQLTDQARIEFAESPGMRPVQMRALSSNQARALATRNAAQLKDYGLGLFELSEEVRLGNPRVHDSVVASYLAGEPTLHRWARTDLAGLPEFGDMNEARDFLNRRLTGTVANIDLAIGDVESLLSTTSGHIYDNRARFPAAYVLARGISETDIAGLGRGSPGISALSIALPVLGPMAGLAVNHNDRAIARTLFDVGILDKASFEEIDGGIAGSNRSNQIALALGVGLSAAATAAPRLWLFVEGRLVSREIDRAATRAVDRMIADRAAGVNFGNAGAQGTRAHTYFEQEMLTLKEQLAQRGSRYGADVELFLSRSTGLETKRRAAGSWGLDVRISRDSIPWKGFDLKTGQFWSPTDLAAREQLFRVPIRQIYRSRSS